MTRQQKILWANTEPNLLDSERKWWWWGFSHSQSWYLLVMLPTTQHNNHTWTSNNRSRNNMATQAATMIHTNATFTSPAIAIEPPISPQQWLLPAACPCFYQHQSRLYYYLPLYPHPRSPAGYHSAPILFKGTVLFGRDHRHQSLGDCSQSASDFM